MVFFICDGCQETLKKSAVDKHASFCRQCYSVTCVDCSVSFEGNNYSAHNVCISEAEKYEKSLYKPKNKAVKRDPQAEWTELIVNASVKPGGKYKDLLSRLTSYTNVPRKLKPFVNFAKNSLKMYNDGLLSDLFTYIQSLAPPRTQNNSNKEDNQADDDNEDDESTNKSLSKKEDPVGSKRKRTDDDEEEEEEEEDNNKKSTTGTTLSASKKKTDEFDMKKHILETLTKKGSTVDGDSSSNSTRLKLKRVKKHAIDTAVDKLGISEEDAEKKFEKKLSKLVRKEKVMVDEKFIWKL